MITIIDNISGNFLSVLNMIKKIGYIAELTNNYDKISKSKVLILPGVGTFDKVINYIYENKIDKAILNAIEENSKLLGICVGMQVLFEKSEEGKLDGLNLIKGEVVKFRNSENKYKIPHMGWNTVNFSEDNKFNKSLKKNRFYFVHSFYAVCHDKKNILGTTNYISNFTSAVKKNNIYGVQFHPEKSLDKGLTLLKNFLEINA